MAEQILSREHLFTLNHVLGKIAETRDKIERAKRAGMDVERAEAELEMQQTLASGLKREFFPGEV